MTIDVLFIVSGREPQCKPDPNYPHGKPVSFVENVLQKTCTWNIPYPAPRCGSYVVTCKKCGYRAAMTVAGWPDDPNMVTMPCRPESMN